MHCIYKILFSTILLFSHLSSAATPPTTVNLTDLELSLNYPQPVRLSQLLSDSENLLIKNNGQATFWLAAQLLEPSKNTEITKRKNQLINQLQALAANYPQAKQKADLLLTLIDHSQFNYRHFISLDNDLVRIQKQLDPMLAGTFSLLTPNRINKIRIVGASNPEKTATFIEHARIDDYLETLTLPAFSNTSVVYFIQPDGVVNESNNAYWNSTPMFVAPGATVFIGFKSLPAEYAQLNSEIAELLRYMPPLTAGETR